MKDKQDTLTANSKSIFLSITARKLTVETFWDVKPALEVNNLFN